MRMLRMCLNWKVLAGLAIVGGGIYAFAPGPAAAALPVLLLAACPLSMLFMMKAMQGDGREGGSQPPPTGADPTRGARPSGPRAGRANPAERTDAPEQDETLAPVTARPRVTDDPEPEETGS